MSSVVIGTQVMMQNGKSSFSPVDLIQEGECRSCKRTGLFWARTRHGKMLLVVPPAEGATIYQPHFADCPQGPTWSKKDKR